MLFGHGDNSYQYNKKLIANFSSNVYFKGPSPDLIKHLQKQLNNIANYPEVTAESLVRQLAQVHSLNTDNFLITNGATEAIYLLAHLFRESVSEIFVPSFSEYIDSCILYEHKIKSINNELLTGKFISGSDVIWLCNPNNPDGKILSGNKLEQLISKNNKSHIIVDEAYADFTLEDNSIINKINQYENLIVIRSLTKKYAIPGLRLGYIVTSPLIISKLLKLKQPWSVNSLAIEAGKFLISASKKTPIFSLRSSEKCSFTIVNYAFSDFSSLKLDVFSEPLTNHDNDYFDIQELISLSKSLQKQLSSINGVNVIKSETSFFLAKLSKPATETTEYLVNNHGLLVRDASNFNGLDKYYIRISTQSEKDNKKLVKALQQWMNVNY